MGGGLMQLVAYGAQDIYLTGNPQITFFKVVYRRHTNFSMEAIEQTWNGSADGQANARCTATISRNGDLVHRMYIELNSKVSDAVAMNPGVAGINTIELEIGGQKIDKHTGKWMETWAELTQPNAVGHTGCPENQTGTFFQNMSGMGGCQTHTTDDTEARFFVPLQFWFCRNPGLALPLIALQYHEVKVILDHTWSNGLGAATDTSGPINKLWCDYIYLDTDERRRFAQVSHEYLIEQVQEQSLSTPAGANELNFNHPVKELIWTLYGAQLSAFCPLELGSSGADVDADTYQLKLNGHDRFAARNVHYFTRVQVYEHHSGCSGITPTGTAAAVGNLVDGIAVYSFALKPEEHQPSGTCNFSRIDNAQLIGAGGTTADTCFAVNYNVLRIMSGMGGLAYSN
jgi:hypothetical protein